MHLPGSRLIALAALLASGLVHGAGLAHAEPRPVREPVGELTVKGSDTIGQHLGQALARAYMERTPGARVRWESIGSGTAFTGLLEGSADLGASSRSIKPGELEQAQELSIKLQEFVLGYDGIAVITHPSNPVEALGLDELAGLFSGAIPSWSGVGGEDRPVHVISRPSYSGTHGFFKDTVLVPNGRKDFGPATEFLEETDAIVRSVAQDPGAISYVGLGFVSGQPLRVLRVRAAPGGEAVAPSEATVRDGSYAIHRPLYLYVRESAPRAAWALLEFVLSAEARPLIVGNHFIPTDVATLIGVRGTPDVAAAPPAARRARAAPLRIFFAFNRVQLGPNGRAALDALLPRLREGARAHIVGHADATGSAAANAVVSEARARAVAEYLIGRGVPVAQLRVEARAADQPLDTNESSKGRSANRRVDLLLGAP